MNGYNQTSVNFLFSIESDFLLKSEVTVVPRGVKVHFLINKAF